MSSAAKVYPAYDVQEHKLSRKYKCCCQTCHVKTGTTIIGVLESLNLVISLIFLIVICVKFHIHDEVLLGANFGSVAVGFLIIVCLFAGIKTERSAFLLPYIISQGLQVICVALMAMVYMIAMVYAGKAINSASSYKEYATQEGVAYTQQVISTVSEYFVVFAVIGGLIIFASLIIQAWFFTVVLRCYQYFKGVEQQRNYVNLMADHQQFKPSHITFY